ncbi:Signal recognition particle receptor FtsY [Fusobacterium sp. DD29]|uniref:signal recognition particle-docking protein FtsY n=1 Tax=unclassified Fusobacterium TaxID=2648384 RepID=UPI001B8C505B|nr:MULTISPECIES: signal recognition particle-docking protein FtsY [unclassified Fusobacterium]MBR8750003.1 Signal recognition particle receptor FtsY [Fusobacterium sp. DD29]MBR8762232.1 Signal recognition particle receptor FtsY [Fusobacterium sp. DD25]MBR8768267.1 Signal recognition particle receptor FtsY [Fusobacterium sp. DD43]MBR8772338.1 Signal recognition particle receptor FtsY [Fusobacterium sp. DD40]MBR8776544.1 Signal recognition particle receptor FtsY [Fusobacterium sp. DD17]
MGFFDRLFKKKKEKEELEVAEIKLDEIFEGNKESNKTDEQTVESKKTENKIIENEETKIEDTEFAADRVLDEVNADYVEPNNVTEEKPEEKKETKKGFFASLREKLFKSREGLFGTLKSFILGRNVIDDDMYEELEDILIQSDIGMDMTLKIVEALEKEVKSRGVKDPKDVYPVLKDVMAGFLINENNDILIEDGRLNVILVVGVNGVGKTTTIGKLAAKYKKEGKKVILGAADTFRAAAVEQLEEWANRSGADIVKGVQGADPGAVVYDTLEAAQTRGADIAIIDTAGRLHNKNNLMQELEKIHNIIKKKLGDQKYESILVIDGTTGQNALTQAKVFNEVTELTGFIITKLDGTAKGGIVFSISEELKKPIKFIGVGEKIEDLRKFNSKEYIDAIFD